MLFQRGVRSLWLISVDNLTRHNLLYSHALSSWTGVARYCYQRDPKYTTLFTTTQAVITAIGVPKPSEFCIRLVKISRSVWSWLGARPRSPGLPGQLCLWVPGAFRSRAVYSKQPSASFQTLVRSGKLTELSLLATERNVTIVPDVGCEMQAWCGWLGAAMSASCTADLVVSAPAVVSDNSLNTKHFQTKNQNTLRATTNIIRRRFGVYETLAP